MDQKINHHCAGFLSLIRQKRPLIHHITNMVVANDNANAMLAIGASPVMALSRLEVEEMTAQADALVLNLGTLNPEIVESCLLAGKAANRKGIPIVLDPVGAGATQFRTRSAKKILTEIKISVLRGNAGEIAALLGEADTMRGVDSMPTRLSPSVLARSASQNYGTVVGVTGKIDYISDGSRLFSVRNGHHLMTAVSGTGCMSSSLCGAFATVDTDQVLTSVSALGFLGVCAEIAGKEAVGPGHFHSVLFDVMYNMNTKTLASLLRIEVES